MNIRYNNDEFNMENIDTNKVYFLSFSGYDTLNQKSKLVGLSIPIKIRINGEGNRECITYKEIKGFLDDEEYIEYNNIKEYIKERNFILNGDDYLNEFWYSSPLIVNLELIKSKYKYAHLSDNLEDIKRDYELLNCLAR